MIAFTYIPKEPEAPAYDDALDPVEPPPVHVPRLRDRPVFEDFVVD